MEQSTVPQERAATGSQPPEQTRTATGEHEGATWELTIGKNHLGLYSAKAEIQYPESMGGHCERIDWADGHTVGIVDGSLRRLRKGERFPKNPYHQCQQTIIGAIDARQDASQARQSLLELLGSTYRTETLEKALALSKRGSELPMTAIFKGEALALALADKRHQQAIEESKMAINPKTNPTPEQLEQMQKAIDDLVERFSIAGLAYIGGYDRQVVGNWKARGRVSAAAANDLCKIKTIKDAGFTREKLRPDVPFWYVD